MPGGTVVRMRSLGVPIDPERDRGALWRAGRLLRRFVGPGAARRRGREPGAGARGGGRRRSGMRWTIIVVESARASRRRRPMLSSSSGRPSRSRARRGTFLAGALRGAGRASACRPSESSPRQVAGSAIPAFERARALDCRTRRHAGRAARARAPARAVPQPGNYGVEETGRRRRPAAGSSRAGSKGDGRQPLSDPRRGARRGGADRRRRSRRCETASPTRAIVVADDGSRDGTADVAEAAGAPRHPAAAARQGAGADARASARARPGAAPALRRRPRGRSACRSSTATADLAIAAFAGRRGRRLRARKAAARTPDRGCSRGLDAREPLSGQRLLSHARAPRRFPLRRASVSRRGMTIDAVRAGLRRRARSSSTSGIGHGARSPRLRPSRPPAGRPRARLRAAGRELPRAAAAARRLGGRRWPSRPWRPWRRSASPTTCGAGRSEASGPTSRAGATTGMLKLVGDPALGARADPLGVRRAARRPRRERRQPARHAPGTGVEGVRARGAPARWAPRRALAVAVLLAPYDLREMAMLGDAGSNALGAC